jgi:hypothetical protein
MFLWESPKNGVKSRKWELCTPKNLGGHITKDCGKPFQVRTYKHFYNVNAKWYIYVNWKPLCDSSITMLPRTQHHYSWTPPSGILKHIKLKRAKMTFGDRLLVTRKDNNLLCIVIITMQQEHFQVSPAMKFQLFLLHGKSLTLDVISFICFITFQFCYLCTIPMPSHHTY